MAYAAATTPGAARDGMEGSATARMGSGDEVGYLDWLFLWLDFSGSPDEELFACLRVRQINRALSKFIRRLSAKIIVHAALRQLLRGAQSPHRSRSKTIAPK